MIELKVLRAFGSSNDRLREVFTANYDPALDQKRTGETREETKARKEKVRRIKGDVDVRSKFERRIQSRIEEGIIFSLKQWRMYAAVDLALDSTIISTMNLPLLMYAQGKINVERAAALLATTAEGTQYVQVDQATKKPVGINIAKFIESEVNLVRSIILRRWAAQKNKYNNLWPYYKYESRSTGLVGKCRADVMSQRADVMADQFGYRRHDGQAMLSGLLYGHATDFPRSSWEVYRQWRMRKNATLPTDVEDYVEKEGIGWFTPHPTRVYFDTNYPLSSLNSDSGCDFVGFWDVMRYRDIEDNPAFFNKDRVGISGRFWGDGGIANAYREYFTNYQYTILAPQTGDIDPAKANDRKAVTGFYCGNHRDSSVFVTNHYEKIVPNDYNIGTYPFPVWTRFVVASDNTVLFAEFLPSRPAAVLSINESDGRLFNVSMAMDVLQFQQHMTNLTNHLMNLLEIESFKAIGINTDALEKAQVESMRKSLNAENWASQPLVFEYSLVKMMERLGVQGGAAAVKEIISISQASVGNSISQVFESMIKLLSLVERLMALSPAEQGQPAPREISATEVNEIANTTSSIYSSISDEIDEFREAKKIIVYESTVACSESQIELPVKGRYTAKTVTLAGFIVKQDEDEDFVGDAKRRTVIGSARNLQHQYIFSSRDGSERPVNTQAANTLVQLMAQVLSFPPIAQKVGKEKLYEMFNEIFRLSGAGLDLNLELAEGEDNSLGEDQLQQLQATVDQIGEYINQLAQQTKQIATDVQGQQQVNDEQGQAIEALAQLAAQVRKATVEIKQLQDAQQTKVEIPYKDAPPEIQAQMEQAAGYVPAKPGSRTTKTSTK